MSVFILLAFAASSRGQAPDAAVEGRRVDEIRVLDEHGAVLPDKLPVIPTQIGKPLDMEEERASLRVLYATGRYSQIRVQAAPDGERLRLDFIVVRNLYNNVIRVDGLKEPPTEASALASVRLPLGEPFRESAVTHGLARLNDALRQEGLYRAGLDYALEPHEDTQQMDVTIHITQGPRARIGAIALVNKSPYKDKDVLRRLRLKPDSKQDATSARVTRGADRLRKKLVADGYLGATVEDRRGEYDAASNHLPLTVEVVTGPHVRVQVVGARYRGGKLRNLLPIYAEGAVDEDLLQEGLRNIRDDLQREGYFDSQVDFTNTEDPAHNERLITYTVTRGVRHHLVSVTFSGNQYFSSKLLSARLQLQLTTLTARGRFSQRMVRDDADSIRGLYLENGFLQADVKPEVVDNDKGKIGELKIHYVVTEGPQTRVADLQIQGNVTLTEKRLRDVIGSSTGQPYSEANVASDRNNMLALYYNDGFPDVRIEGVATPVGDTNRINLVYRITEGTQIDVLRVLLTGYEHTRYGVIARQVQVKPGGPFREGDVVDTQRRLYNLAIFNRVQIAPQNPSGTDADKTVVVAVEEGKRYTFGYGFGFEVQQLSGSGANPTGTTLNASPRVILELGKANLFGRAQSLSFKIRASTLQYRAVLSYNAPQFLTNPRLNFGITGYADKTQDVYTFNSERYEAAIQLVQTVSPSVTILYRYFFRHVLVDANSLKISPEEIPLFSQPTRISGEGVNWVRDRRNSAADATKGTFNTVDLSFAEKAVGSSASFFRGFYQNSTFTPFWHSFVFARAFRFGVEQPLPDTAVDEIPLPERFFAGGGQSIRGFGLNQAGPRDPVTGFPVGGLALMEFNQELRFPMKLPFVGTRLGGTLLYDAGNVYTDVNHITFRTTPSSMTELNYFSHTIGAGVRYQTPIGPVRLDFGYQLNPAKFQFINSTTNLPEVQQLPHFQFFFNIGPVF
jgi:outer membrane protein insertion porin family